MFDEFWVWRLKDIFCPFEEIVEWQLFVRDLNENQISMTIGTKWSVQIETSKQDQSKKIKLSAINEKKLVQCLIVSKSIPIFQRFSCCIMNRNAEINDAMLDNTLISWSLMSLLKSLGMHILYLVENGPTYFGPSIVSTLIQNYLLIFEQKADTEISWDITYDSAAQYADY